MMFIVRTRTFGVSGYLPAVYSQRVAELHARMSHRTISSGNHLGADLTDGETSAYPHGDNFNLAQEKSEESYEEWKKYWQIVGFNKPETGMLKVIGDNGLDLKSQKGEGHKDSSSTGDSKETTAESVGKKRRWMLAMRHGERVDLTYGTWVPYCFDDNGKYIRKDLNMPTNLGPRKGGKDSYALDTPLTRVGQFQAYLVGESLRQSGIKIKHVYASAALRCVETAQNFLLGLQADPSVKIRVEPGLFEYTIWYHSIGTPTFMTTRELLNNGLNVDMNYKPYVDLDPNNPETLDDYFKRNELIMKSAWKESEAEGSNIMFVGHAATLDIMVLAFKRLAENKTDEPNYQISKNLLRVPYCAVGAVRDNPWEVVPPPCPPSFNSSSARFNWKMLLDV